MAVGVAVAINLVLTGLILFAGATVGDYGECTVRVNGDREVKAAGGRSLLSTLKDSGIFIPSACGGRGSCGLCKVRVEGGGEPLATELPWLSKDEVKGGVRLACQVKVKGDLAIRIPEELLSVAQYEVEVASIADLTHDIKEVRLKLIEPGAMTFKAGQYVQFEVPAYKLTDEPVYRAYSISSDPVDRGAIELEIRYVPNGICTTYVHRHLKVGERVNINGPYGDFRLSDTGRDVIFIAGGSGMAPIKSMLLEMARTGCRRNAEYYFGARSREDLFLEDLMQRIEREMPSFRFIPSLAAPEGGDEWSGETGLVTDVVGRRAGDVSEKEAYLCGSPLMIDACVELLKKKGMPEDRIFYDKFS